jgi:hypothetical protein
LSQASTRADITQAFKSSEIPPHHLSIIQPFIRSTTLRSTAFDVRTAKQAVKKALKKAVTLEKALRVPADRVRLTLQALQQPRIPPEQRVIVSAHHRRRLDEYAPLRAEADDHDEELKRLQTVQAKCDAGFSQDQLLLFVRKGKYKWTPRNLAHALAGLPSMGWEQSFKRCGKKKQQWAVREYRVFQMIEKCTDKSPDLFKALLEESIRSLPGRKPNDIALRESLFGNWRYLRMAIDEALALDDASERLPYRVFEIYTRRIRQGRDANEQFLVSMEALTDP